MKTAIVCLASLLVLLSACGGGGSDCPTCDSPPADTCKDANTLLQYPASGRCVDGECVYEPQEAVCEHGCEAGACQAVTCADMVCDMPPGPCYQAAGSCVEDPEPHCVYTPLADGTACDDESFCNGHETCQQGSCEDGEPFACPPTADPCVRMECVEEIQGCERRELADGTECDDGDPCTDNDACLAGVCTGEDICGQDEVALIFYMAADNDLDEYMELDWHELEQADVDGVDWLRVFVLIDQSPYAERSDTRLYEIHDGQSSELDALHLGLTVAGREELDMADASNVTAFIQDVRAVVGGGTAIFLMMNDHGDGWWRKGPADEPTGKGCCYDETTGSDVFISNQDLHAAVAGQGLALIGFDACLQGMADVAYELRQDAEIMIGSQELEGAWGWAYVDLLDAFGQQEDHSPLRFAQLAVDTYIALCQEERDETGTLAVYDLAAMDALAGAATPAASALAALSGNDYWSICDDLVWYGCDGWTCEEYVDLAQLVELARSLDPGHSSAYDGVLAALEEVVLYEDHGRSHPEARGMNVYFPCEYYPYEEYEDVSWAQATGWWEMVNAH